MRSRLLFVLVSLALVSLSPACGDDDGPTTAEDAGGDSSVRLDARTDDDAGPTPTDAGPTDAAIADSGTTMDAAMDRDAGPGVDAGPMDCVAEVESTLDGVRIEVPDQPCTFTLAEAAAGVEFLYDVVVAADVAGISYERACFEPGPSGLVTRAIIRGGSESYCICDVGLCMSRTETTTAVAGSHRTTFGWEGRNWTGPSDFGNPMGDPFPPGDYTLEITSSGMHDGAAFALTTRFPIHVVP